MTQRTSQQNKGLHLFFTMLADELNNSGYDQRKVLKETVDIPWTPEAIKEQLWKPIQKLMYNKESTTELDKVKEIDKVHEVLMRHLGEKFSVEYIPFPVDEHRVMENIAPKKHNELPYDDNYQEPTI